MVPFFQGDAAGLGDVPLEILREALGNAIVEHGQVISSLIPKERLSIFVDPTMDQTPSTIMILAWVIAASYS